MTIDYATKRREVVRQTAAAIDAIRNQKMLTPEGKRAAIAGAYMAGRDELSSLVDAEQAYKAQRVAKLEEQLLSRPDSFDQGASVIAWRDARERVAALGAHEQERALQLMSQAVVDRDESLARALLRRSFEARWGDVANRYIEAHPSLDGPVTEFWNVTESASDPALVARLAILNADQGLERPHEIGGLHDEELRRLAANADTIQSVTRLRGY